MFRRARLEAAAVMSRYQQKVEHHHRQKPEEDLADFSASNSFVVNLKIVIRQNIDFAEKQQQTLIQI